MSVKPLIRVVTATRLPEAEFKRCPLGQSLLRLSFDKRICSAAAFENRAGLSEVFNRALILAGDEEPDILVFCHDDVRIDDIYLANHVLEGLQHFDVIGVAGAKTRQKNQLVWAGLVENCDPSTFTSLIYTGALSGGVGSVSEDGTRGVDFFGLPPAECELLDGVFLAVRRSTLVKNGIYFDQNFKFHFYDLDFCRNARAKGLRLGTWPISITHEYTSAGYFSTEWRVAAQQYLAKWGE